MSPASEPDPREPGRSGVPTDPSDGPGPVGRRLRAGSRGPRALGSGLRALAGPRRAAVLGIFVLVLALGWTFRGFATGDPSDVTHFILHETRAAQGTGSFAARVDTRFVVWLVSRNARTWTTAPARLFDGEICHPTPSSIALGEPALSLGLVGVPAWWLTGDPIWTFNFVSVAIVALAALAMFVLVRDWTDSAGAATVAALSYGFHPLKIADPIHLYVPDTAWTVFAIFFFVRFLERGRWRDVLALAAATAMQIGGSLYPLIAAGALGAPIAVWGLARIGPGRTRPLQWVVLAGVVGLALCAVFAPFLDKAAAGDLATRPSQIHLPWSQILGFGPRALGWGLIALAGLSLLPLPASERRRSPRVALWIGAALCLALATGGNEVARQVAAATGEPPPFAWPNLFRALGAVLPGLDVVRLPANVGHGAYLALSLLAGLGVAAAMKRLPGRLRAPATIALVAIVFVNTLRPGLPGAVPLATWSQRPADSELAFFDELEALGNAGPILEVPNPPRPHPRYGHSILLSAYHHRRTSGCYNSFLPAETLEAEAEARALPAPAAIEAAADMGFTTLLLHEDARGADALAARIAAAQPARLEPIHTGAGMAAWSIQPSPRAELDGSERDEAERPAEGSETDALL